MPNIISQLRDVKVVPVIRTSTAKAAERAVNILAEEGFSCFELTMTTPDAASLIKNLSQKSGILVGAGTVLTTADLNAVADAGAEFIVSPAIVEGMAQACQKRNLPYLPGTSTASEVLAAHNSGVPVVKLFPAGLLGGPAFVKTMLSVFPDIIFMPTGSVTPDNMMAYLQAGALCVGMGGNLVNDQALQAGDDEVIRHAARQVKAILAGGI
ncbi:MAG: bifunctional 4-hydroxy-2-oxoglutarate aldolase/2-dehydro-3-deoxy-phosphogluconate aldolase [Rhizobiales bacterium]|nr:bifunctional 4-hydroxy-2-oxoglutarate aldolase/2-dehydro-3-deoxy-phosphogluconate aldolase [Hyphomicrobiales bacterium]NRB15815.1 bifunctional 4-hydroxy-2-oxoglutarate aldolase/2-dehydro-3-deoxy-phosphogluconate aldolase [Hyphomicrobiales bacterium]